MLHRSAPPGNATGASIAKKRDGEETGVVAAAKVRSLAPLMSAEALAKADAGARRAALALRALG
ncbi:hypothetical protein NK6_4372 [Bradyrhizobium diazoefficiens]|uniref:Uncharacterized protein n=1 Tax=Bradyrhizobium diazoefficiens TaxID=1355477 RepID=A0A0E3VUJ9_9BRAD|nr:hypothetical protein NK6_4372 [Bradyrhizobium diazoefficiens]